MLKRVLSAWIGLQRENMMPGKLEAKIALVTRGSSGIGLAVAQRFGQKALPMLSDGAAIILTGSTAGSEGIAAFGVYAATKAAIRSFARTWATDLKERKIRVNVISPGPIETPGLAGLASDDDTRRGMYAAFASQIPLGRLGQPDEVARVASFLASEDATFVNGIELFVDGGAAQV
jgi:NAD(P)-dependent dehydrogenase (short-subunit alcohol dehydrogenase family)